MKTKLLKKLRRRALRRIKFVYFQKYIAIAEVTWYGKVLKQYESFTLNDFNTFSKRQLKYALDVSHRDYILGILKKIKESLQAKLIKKRIDMLNHIDYTTHDNKRKGTFIKGFKCKASIRS